MPSHGRQSAAKTENYSRSQAESFMSAFELCNQALSLDDSDPDSLAFWGIT